MSVRLAWLYVRSRAPIAHLTALLTVSLLSAITPAPGGDGLARLFLVVFGPMMPAATIGLGLYSPIRAIERSLPVSVGRIRLAHLGLFLILLWISAVWPVIALGNDLPWDFLTNLAGYAGLVLVWAACGDPRMSWLVVVVYGTATFVPAFQHPEHLPDLERRPLFWPVAPAGAAFGLLAEMALLGVGLLSTWIGPVVRSR